MNKIYKNYLLTQLKNLIEIPSPSGYTERAQDYLEKEVKSLGFEIRHYNRGGLSYCLGGEGNPIAVMAHIDTIGVIVKEIKPNGRIYMLNIGGLSANNIEATSATLFTRYDGPLRGTIQLKNASTHVNPRTDVVRNFSENVEFVLDKDVRSAEDVRKLGVENGDMIALDPGFEISSDGYIKSRFLDDKIGIAILLAFSKFVRENNIKLNRKVYICFSVYEEVLHGGAYMPSDDVAELLSIDMGCVGEGMEGTEQDVCIIARDSRGPYPHTKVTKLVDICRENNLNYAIDCYDGYVSDSSAALTAGYDFVPLAFGPGVYASHGYERLNIKGVENTLNLLSIYTSGRKFG